MKYEIANEKGDLIAKTTTLFTAKLFAKQLSTLEEHIHETIFVCGPSRALWAYKDGEGKCLDTPVQGIIPND